jgi:hypothetical protein
MFRRYTFPPRGTEHDRFSTFLCTRPACSATSDRGSRSSHSRPRWLPRAWPAKLVPSGSPAASGPACSTTADHLVATRCSSLRAPAAAAEKMKNSTLRSWNGTRRRCSGGAHAQRRPPRARGRSPRPPPGRPPRAMACGAREQGATGQHGEIMRVAGKRSGGRGEWAGKRGRASRARKSRAP